jgi:uncharacterized protein (DUF427 family)
MTHKGDRTMAEHITIEPAEGEWVIRAGGAVLAESSAALELTERGHNPVIYFPRTDVAMAFLEPSSTVSTCPHKGEARYYSIIAKSGAIKDAAWSYETPVAGMEGIVGYLAFYPGKVAIEQV